MTQESTNQAQHNDLFSIQPSLNRPLAVKYPADKESLTQFAETHSPHDYDRSRIGVEANPCALPGRSERVYTPSPTRQRVGKATVSQERYPSTLGLGRPPARAQRGVEPGITEEAELRVPEARYARPCTPHPQSCLDSDEEDDMATGVALPSLFPDDTGSSSDGSSTLVDFFTEEFNGKFLIYNYLPETMSDLT